MKQKHLFLALISFLLFSCGGSNQEPSIPACEVHDYQEVEKVDPTCTENGFDRHFYCSTCHHYFTYWGVTEVKKEDLIIPALGHLAGEEVIFSYPTHESSGSKGHRCVRCDTILDEETIPQLTNHVYNQHVQEEDYLYQFSNCLGHNIYYTSCICGVSSKGTSVEETFAGDIGPHEFFHHEGCESTLYEDGWDEYYTCNVCNKYFTNDKGEYTEIYGVPTHQRDLNLTKKYQGKVVETIPDLAKNYYDLIDDPNTENNEIAQYLRTHQYDSKVSASGFSLIWEDSKKNTYPMTVRICKDKEMTDVYREIKGINYSRQDIYNLAPGTYYYQVFDSSNPVHYSIRDSFVIEHPLHPINNSCGIQNMRDLGGYSSVFGGSIQYDLVYRSANWQSVGIKGEQILKDDLGIKNEVDVRFNKSGEADHSSSEHPISGINYVHAAYTDSYSIMLTDTSSFGNLKTLLTKMEDKEFYPFTFHCTSGADRTGFIAMIIEGILGVSDEDIYKDYELTTFFYSNRFRSNVNCENGIYSFDPSGVYDLTSWSPSFGALCKRLLTNYKTETNTLSASILRFVKETIGVSEQTITNIQSILLTNNVN